MTEARGKTLRRSMRLPGYDYSQPGAYFVSLVAAGRQCLFGETAGREMRLSIPGQIAHQQWLKLPARFPHVELGAFVVMPNHVHGILIVHDAGRGTARHRPDRAEEMPRRAPTEEFGRPVPSSIPTVIRSYKAAVAYRIHLMRGNERSAVWQRNYYEHVIRDEREWDTIRRYIESNLLTWSEDSENIGAGPS